MNSKALKENGFSEASPLKELTFTMLPQEKNSVFAIIDLTQTGKTNSDILYIGRSKKPAKRIFGGYLSGFGGKTTRRINSKLFTDGYLEKTAISWTVSDKPKTTQQQLLEKFKKEHGEYPTWNAPAKKAPAKPKPAAKPKPKPQAPTVAKTTKPRGRPRKKAKKTA
ncbi:MAG: hypothetical protein NWF00_03650 [Candidatus Bathyarchaeota archaeon]|nr:hypothetical protein [Candidatus Bathyarchaeota archaeon]